MPFNVGGNIWNGATAKTHDYRSVVSRGLVLHIDPKTYHGNGTVTGEVGGNKTGTLNDAAVGTTTKDIWTFDGSDYITISNHADFTFGTEQFAWQIWLKFTNYAPGGDTWVTALQHSSAENRRNGVFLFYGGASPDIEWRAECNWAGLVSGTGWYPKLIDLDPYVDLNEWHMYTISRESDELIHRYVDTTLVDSDTTADGATGPRGVTYESTWPDMNGDLLLADYRAADHHEFQGEMGPVRIYKGASLSSAQVSHNYDVERLRFGV